MFYITQYCSPCSPYPSPGSTPRLNPGGLIVIFHQNWVLGWSSHKIGPIHATKKSKDPKVCNMHEGKVEFPGQLWKELNVYPVWLTMMTMSYMHPGDLCHLYFEVLPRKYQYWDSRQVLPYLFQNLSKRVKLISTQFWVWRIFWAVWNFDLNFFYSFTWRLWCIFWYFSIKMSIHHLYTAHFLRFPNFVKFSKNGLKRSKMQLFWDFFGQ